MPTINSININGEPMQLATTVQLDTYVKKDAFQEAIDLSVENKNDINNIKEITQIHDMRLSQQDREIYDLREKVKEALAVLHHPGRKDSILPGRIRYALCHGKTFFR